MNKVLNTMNDDHQKLERLFNKLLVAIQNNHAISLEVFSKFKQILQKHFIWEEKVLFPLFEKRSGLSGGDTIFVLRNEHHQINKMFIAKIEGLLHDNLINGLQPLITGLEEMLTMHRKMETEIFYPWFDEVLENGEKDNIIDNFKESEPYDYSS